MTTPGFLFKVGLDVAPDDYARKGQASGGGESRWHYGHTSQGVTGQLVYLATQPVHK
jgi:hypothetical protein